MNKKHQHKHMNRFSRVCVDFYACMNPSKPNPSAWNDFCCQDVCKCGYRRIVNVNQGSMERSPWVEKTDQIIVDFEHQVRLQANKRECS